MVLVIKRKDVAETGLAQWIECWSADWKVSGSILVKSIYIGRGHIRVGGVQEAAGRCFSLIDVSSSLSPFLC